MDYDMDSMNEEELRAALVSKDEMVKELEDKIAEMMADSEAQMTSEETAEADTPAVVEQAEEVKEEEEEKEEVTVKMSETLDATPALLSEINKLREEVASLKSDKETVQRREAVGQLLREGRITPSEEDAASQAWDQRNTSPVFWALFCNSRSAARIADFAAALPSESAARNDDAAGLSPPAPPSSPSSRIWSDGGPARVLLALNRRGFTGKETGDAPAGHGRGRSFNGVDMRFTRTCCEKVTRPKGFFFFSNCRAKTRFSDS